MDCGGGEKCLAWGKGIFRHCYAGRITVPTGLKVTAYQDFECGDKEKKKTFQSSAGKQDFWNTHERFCSFKIEEIEPTPQPTPQPTPPPKDAASDPYITTFNAIGCPNKDVEQTQMDWWKKVDEKVALGDMSVYCKLVSDGEASNRQLETCCGSKEDPKCTTKCNKVEKLIEASDPYITTFNAIGCPNKDVEQTQMDWWKKVDEKVALGDMSVYCKLVSDGEASNRQLETCCGSKEDPKCTTKCNKVDKLKR